MNWSVKPWMESVRLTMADQESVFHYQLEELHRIYRKQVELEGTAIGRSQDSRKRVKKLKLGIENEMVNFNELIEVQIQVEKDMDGPTTPETTNSTMARGKQVLQEEEQAMSAAVALIAMSSSLVRASSDSLLWFANIVTSVRRDVDMASVRKQMPRQHGKRDVTYVRKQMPGQHGKRHAGKKKKGTKVKACIPSWGRIKKGRRSKRVPAEDPAFTFERGAMLSRWR